MPPAGSWNIRSHLWSTALSGEAGLLPVFPHPWPPTGGDCLQLTLIHVTPACNLTLVSRRERAACLREADGLNELGADSTALPLLLQPDQDWEGGRPGVSLGSKAHTRQKSTADSPMKWVEERWPVA